MPGTREEVIADVRAGMSIRKAAKKHGVPSGTACRWWSETKDKTRAELPRYEPPARDPSPAREPPPPPEPASPSVRLPPEVGPEVRSNWRRATLALSSYIAHEAEKAAKEVSMNLPVTVDMRNMAHASRAMDVLLHRVPEAASIDERTSDGVGGGGAVGSADELAELREAAGAGDAEGEEGAPPGTIPLRPRGVPQVGTP